MLLIDRRDNLPNTSQRQELHNIGCRVSLFMDADIAQNRRVPGIGARCQTQHALRMPRPTNKPSASPAISSNV